jgi:hypothetical protein
MAHDTAKRVARIDRRELAALPMQWTDLEKGYQLRLLLRERGIDPNRLYFLTYHPRHHCWLFTQQGPEPGAVPLRPDQGDAAFYHQLAGELRRTARLACAAPGAAWVRYQLPDRPQELTPADLAIELGGWGEYVPVRFTWEGGLQSGPSSN